jgi:hypothetical protein
MIVIKTENDILLFEKAENAKEYVAAVINPDAVIANFYAQHALSIKNLMEVNLLSKTSPLYYETFTTTDDIKEGLIHGKESPADPDKREFFEALGIKLYK